jgi:hypothetical protein
MKPKRQKPVRHFLSPPAARCWQCTLSRRIASSARSLNVRLHDYTRLHTIIRAHTRLYAPTHDYTRSHRPRAIIPLYTHIHRVIALGSVHLRQTLTSDCLKCTLSRSITRLHALTHDYTRPHRPRAIIYTQPL